MIRTSHQKKRPRKRILKPNRENNFDEISEKEKELLFKKLDIIIYEYFKLPLKTFSISPIVSLLLFIIFIFFSIILKINSAPFLSLIALFGSFGLIAGFSYLAQIQNDVRNYRKEFNEIKAKLEVYGYTVDKKFPSKK